MSIHRYDAKVDGTQAEIISGLKAAHVEVWSIRLPCDLLCRFWCSKHQAHCWQPLEVKVLAGKRVRKVRVRKDRAKQTEFLVATDTPVVTSFYEAWQALNARHHIGQ